MTKTASILTYVKNLSTQLLPWDASSVAREQAAWWLVCAVTERDKKTLLTQPNIELSEEQKNIVAEWVAELTLKHKPLQYILGSVPFLDLTIIVEPPILIPRPETEEWVERVIGMLKNVDTTSLKILDIGTGSGCIALALAQALPHATVIAVDINPQALALAEKNARANGISNIRFIESDLFSVLDESFDLIVSNPPYISDDEFTTLAPNVAHWEDKRALVAENNGLHIIATIITQSLSRLRTNQQLIESGIPQLIIEIGYKQGSNVVELMQAAGFDHTQIWQDIAGNDRVVGGSRSWANNTKNSAKQ